MTNNPAGVAYAGVLFLVLFAGLISGGALFSLRNK